MKDIVGGAMTRVRQGDSPADALDRQSIVSALSRNTNLTRAEAERAATQVQAQLQDQLGQAQQKAGDVGEAAAGAGKKGAWGFFVYGLLTLLAAAFGGAAGVPREHRVLGRDERAVPGGPLTPQRA
jgi:hypothetical protein